MILINYDLKLSCYGSPLDGLDNYIKIQVSEHTVQVYRNAFKIRLEMYVQGFVQKLQVGRWSKIVHFLPTFIP